MLMYKDDTTCTVNKQQVDILKAAGWSTSAPEKEEKVTAPKEGEKPTSKAKKPAKRTVKKD